MEYARGQSAMEPVLFIDLFFWLSHCQKVVIRTWIETTSHWVVLLCRSLKQARFVLSVLRDFILCLHNPIHRSRRVKRSVAFSISQNSDHPHLNSAHFAGPFLFQKKKVLVFLLSRFLFVSRASIITNSYGRHFKRRSWILWDRAWGIDNCTHRCLG